MSADIIHFLEIKCVPVKLHFKIECFLGLGGVRYAPEGWEQLLTDQVKEELNNLNIALVDTLRSTDSAFSLGEGADGLMCVRFGMLTPQSDVEELLNLVIRVGQSVEENSRVLDSMAEIVRKGKQINLKNKFYFCMIDICRLLNNFL